MSSGIFDTSSIDRQTTIQSSLSSRTNESLLQYVIKSSFNSAYDGKFISLKAIDNVLSQGCRFLDLEIYSIKGVPIVGYSTDATYSSLINTNSPQITLNQVLTEIVSNAFTGVAPNIRDPVFIHLRIKTTCGLNNNSVCDIYNTVAGVIKTTIGSRLYTDPDTGNILPVSGSTRLADIMGKVIIIIDGTTNPDFMNYAVCSNTDNSTCYSLRDYVNAQSGNSSMPIYTYSQFVNMKTTPLTVDSQNPHIAEPSTSSLALNIIFPDDYLNTSLNSNNLATPNDIIANHGGQIIAYKFYNKDTGLSTYNALFDVYKTAFIPLGYAVQYITTGKPNTSV